MTSIFSAEKIAEIKNYEVQMSDYFSHYSTKLREWYLNGGEQSDDYKNQCNRLREEYNRYMKYIQQFRAIVNSGVSADQNQSDTVLSNAFAAFSHGTNIATNKSTTCSTASVAANYTRYYQDMINYFGNVLESIQHNEVDSNESSDEETGSILKQVPTKNIDKEQTTQQIQCSPTQTSLGANYHCADPDVVMKEYFNRYVETGQWDWASWNNYLSWIARTYPQWHDIFLKLSRDNGIDWTDMYDKWRHPFNGTPVSSHKSINQTVTNSYSNVLTYTTHINQEESDEELDWNYCLTCDLQFESERIFNIHLRGIKHTQLVLEKNTLPVNEQPIEEEPWQVKHHAWIKSQYVNNDNSAFELSGTFYCELCEVEFPSYKALGSHLDGRRHRENVTIFEKTGDRNQLKGKRPIPVKLISKIQPFLDVCTEPIIGLNYLIEYQLKNIDDCLYLCYLCYQWFPQNFVIRHFCSSNHRQSYLNAHYLDLYKIIDNDESETSVKDQRLNVYARKIEDFEGRKRLMVRQENVQDLKPVNNLINETKHSKRNSNSEYQTSDKKTTSSSMTCGNSIDLEEGEVKDESSDEGSVPDSDVDSGDINSSFFIRYGTIIDFIQNKRDSEANTNNSTCQNNNPTLRSKLITTKEECDAFMKSLKANGHLNLKQFKSGNKRTHRSKNKYTEQFSIEVEWILDKLKQIKAKEKMDSHLAAADVTARARILATKHHSRFDNKNEFLQDNKNVIQQKQNPCSATRSNTESSIVCEKQYANNVHLLKKSDSSSVIKILQTQTVVSPTPKHLSASPPKSDGYISLSSNAFHAILSAIETLKSSSSGNLNANDKPKINSNTFLSSSNGTDSSVKDNRSQLQIAKDNTNRLIQNFNDNILNSSIKPTAIVGQQFVQPHNSQDKIHPITTTMDNIQSKPVICEEFDTLKTIATQISNISDEPEANSRYLVDSSTTTNNVPIYQQINQNTSESIFDAYSIVSRRSEQRKQARLQKIAGTQKYPKFLPKGGGTAHHQDISTIAQQSNTGSKLSAIADFLGLNQPYSNKPKNLTSQKESTIVTCVASPTPYLPFSTMNSPLNNLLYSLIPPSSNTLNVNRISENRTNVTYSSHLNPLVHQQPQANIILPVQTFIPNAFAFPPNVMPSIQNSNWPLYGSLPISGAGFNLSNFIDPMQLTAQTKINFSNIPQG